MGRMLTIKENLSGIYVYSLDEGGCSVLEGTPSRERVQERVCEFLGLPSPAALHREAHLALEERNQARAERDKWKSELGTVRAQLKTAAEQHALYAQQQTAERELQDRVTSNALFQRGDARVERDKALRKCDAALSENKALEGTAFNAQFDLCFALAERDDARKERDEARHELEASRTDAHERGLRDGERIAEIEAQRDEARRVVGERDRALACVKRLTSERDAQAQARDATAVSLAGVCKQITEMRKERDALKLDKLDKLAKRAYENGKAKGFWKEPPYADYGLCVERMASKLALIHSEVSEALEVVRKKPLAEPSPHGIACTWLEEEIADVLIRCFAFAHAYGLGLDNAVAVKMAYNESRPHKHGGKVI